MKLLQTVGRHLTIWKAAWHAEAARPVAAALCGKTVEFLPAVLEIQHAPPSPIGRAILWTIMLVFTAGIVWASISWIDIVAVAPGKIIASGYSKVIQPYETGVIEKIHVVDGQVVKQGDVLIELDTTLNRADGERAANERRAALVEAARLRALAAGQLTFEAPGGSDPHYVTIQSQLLHDQVMEYQARVQASQHLIDQRRAAAAVTQENIRRLEATVPMEDERVRTLKQLMEHDAATKMDYMQAEAQRIDRTQELAGQRQRLWQDRAALAEAEKSLRAFLSEFQQTKQAEVATLETKATSLAQDMVKADQRIELQKLISPIDGVVQQLAVHTIGGVVTPAQQLLMVVPQDHPVEIEAQVENKDIGFVEEGQPVEIKVETFPFTLYGTIPGRVLTVSDDAVPLDKEKGGLIYATRVSLGRSTIAVQRKDVNLSPGMAVTVEIKTGQRRIIEYLLSPLLKSVKESLRER